MKSSIKDFFSKCDKILFLLKKSVIENLIFYAVWWNFNRHIIVDIQQASIIFLVVFILLRLTFSLKNAAVYDFTNLLLGIKSMGGIKLLSIREQGL